MKYRIKKNIKIRQINIRNKKREFYKFVDFNFNLFLFYDDEFYNLINMILIFVFLRKL